MNKYSRVSLAALACGALCFASTQVRAQSGGVGASQNPPGIGFGTGPTGDAGAAAGGSIPAASGGMSNSMGETSTMQQGGNYDNSLQTLPTEPTAAGYANAGGPRYSWIPYTTSGYIGLGLGNGSIDAECVPGLSCDDPRGAVHVYTGGMFTPYFGVQLGYFRLDDTDRNGGKTKISGANISLIGVVPLGTQFSLLGRVGGTYGWTDVTTGIGGVTLTDEEEKGFVPSFGAGVSWDFHRNLSLTLDWDRHNLKYPDGDKHNTDIATIGLKYRF